MQIVSIGKVATDGTPAGLAGLKPELEAAGHRLEVHDIPSGWWRRFRLWRSLTEADAVVLHNCLLARIDLLLLRRHARRLVLDFAGAMLYSPRYSRDANDHTDRVQRLAAAADVADAVVTDSDGLKSEIAHFADASRIHLLIPYVSLNVPVKFPQFVSGPMQLVWTGDAVDRPVLERMRPVLQIVARHLPGIRFKLITDRIPVLDDVPTITVSRSAETEELAEADIGISWLPAGREWAGTSRILRYMAAGLPVVANPTGDQARFVRHGETGFLADSPPEWVDAIRWLVLSAELRERFGLAGRRLVEQEHSPTRAAERWLEVIDHVCAASRRIAA